MGAHFKSMVIKTQVQKKMEKKFWEIYDHDRSYYGTNPYSGSWATFDGVRVIKDPFPERKWTKKKYDDVLEWIMDYQQKWEDVYAIKTPKGYLIGGWAAT